MYDKITTVEFEHIEKGSNRIIAIRFCSPKDYWSALALAEKMHSLPLRDIRDTCQKFNIGMGIFNNDPSINMEEIP